MLIYADASDIEAEPWEIATPPPNINRLLASASMLVRSATINDVYATDETGLPTDPTVVSAFRDAVCAQVVTWMDLAINPSTGAATAGKAATSKSIGSASISYAGAGIAAAERAKVTTALTPDATQILQHAGLGTATPRSW